MVDMLILLEELSDFDIGRCITQMCDVGSFLWLLGMADRCADWLSQPLRVRGEVDRSANYLSLG